MEANDYCSYELSTALKAAGFDEPCRYLYGDGVLKRNCSKGNFNAPREIRLEDSYLEICSAPTLWQAQKWLREKGIDIEIRVWIVGNEREYRPYIMPPKCRDFIAYPPKKLYESALSAGIEAAL